MGAELFHADRQTDEANSVFSQFCERAYKGFWDRNQEGLSNCS
jgi:hypothetical protein